VNQKTGEKKELSMTMLEYGQWKEENPEWDKDWSQGCAGVGEVGDWRNKLTSKHPSWNEVLGRAQKMPGSTVKKL
jgi:hypothetical protein